MTDVLLRATELCKRFTTRGSLGRRSEHVAVDRVSFTIAPGETLAVVGESGSGKSTTARMVARLLTPDSGRLEFDGTDVTAATGAALAAYRKQVQVVFQDPYSSLNPRHTVERIITAPLRYQRVASRRDRRAVAQDLMERVGLDPDQVQRYPRQFSGGQAQRIGIARALAIDPKLVICDEAVSALDVSVQAQILDLLRGLQRDSGFSYLFIAHDLAVVRQIAHRVAVMNAGRIVESGPCSRVFDDPRHPYTRELLAAIPRIDPEWDRRRRARTVEAEEAR